MQHTIRNDCIVCIFSLITIFILLTEYSMGAGEETQILDYPNEVLNNGTEFDVFCNAQNFSFGTYAVMLSILNSSNNTIGQVFDPSTNEWESSYYYLYNYLTINSGNTAFSIKARINPDKNYNGSATLQLKLKDSSSHIYSSVIYPFTVLNITPNSNTNTTNLTNSTNNTSESSIEILDYPENTQFGKTVKIDFHVYKGDTGKYAVYAYIENGDGEKVSSTAKVHAGNSSSSTKYRDYYFEGIEIELKCLDESGDYDLIISGLDAEDRKEISIDSCDDSTNSEIITGESTKIEYYVYNQESANVGEKIITKINLINNEKVDNVFSVWSYVYRSSKCYSCIDSREENSQQIFVSSNSESEISLENIVDEADEGNYSLKVKILKQGLKTPKEFTFPIYLTSSVNSNGEITENYEQEIVSGNIMQNFDEFGNYKEINSKKSILIEAFPYIISSLALLFCVFLLLKKI